MKGIHFVVDEDGRRNSVVIDLRKHADLWEDFYDSLIAKMREDEPRDTLSSVKARLRRAGKIRG
ncbi:MAG: hypothetical protein HY961_14815 [Ignavibacteriae bacterium]|nr:hypothetical protein [Ignavibacteriota bacterium]